MVLVFAVLSYVLVAAQIVIFARVILSWFDPTGKTLLGAFVFKVTNPILTPIRRMMPTTGVIDFSPTVALLVIFLLQRLLRQVAGGG